MSLVSGSGFAKKGYPIRTLFSIPFVGLNSKGTLVVLNEKGQMITDDIDSQECTKADFLKYEGPINSTHIGPVGSTFSYHDLRLNIFFIYAFGNVVRLDPKFHVRYNDSVSMISAPKNRWMAAGEEAETSIPGILPKSQYMTDTNVCLGCNAYSYSDAHTTKGDFIRLKEISLDYDSPTQMLQNSMTKNVSLKLQATNLFLLHADKRFNGQDPEFYNVDGVALSMPKRSMLTVKLGP